MDRGAWWATEHGIAELDRTERVTHTHTHTVCIYQSQSPHLLSPPYPLVTVSLFSTSMSLLLFCKEIRLYPLFFRFHI